MGNIHVFVYGTLKPGGTYHQQFCAPYLKKSQPAQVRGLLYDLPALGYPAMTLGPGWVQGYLFTLDGAAMAGLDYLEGYNAPGEENAPGDDDFEAAYTRLRTTVFDSVGQPMGSAWVYVMGQPPAGAVFLPQGHWEGA